MARSNSTSKTTSKTTTAKEATHMSDFHNFLTELHDLTAKYLSGEATVEETKAAVEETAKPAAKTAAKKATAKAAPVEDEADEVDEADDAPDYSKMSVAKLRKLVIEAGFDPEDVKGADKETLIDALTDPDSVTDEDEDDEDEDSDPTPDVDDADDDADDEDDDLDEDEDEDEDELTREELEGMTVAALRKMARDDYEATPAEVKGLDKESLIDFILDDAGDEDADDDGIEDDEEGYTEDELAEMTLDELREVCDEWDIEYPAKARAKSLIKIILEAQEEVDEDDE